MALFWFLVLDASAFPPWVGSADILLRRSHLAFTEMAFQYCSILFDTFQYFSILFNTFHFFLGSDKVSSRRPFQFLEVRGWQAWVESDRRGNRVAWRFVLYMWYHMFKVRICPKLWAAFEDYHSSHSSTASESIGLRMCSRMKELLQQDNGYFDQGLCLCSS